MPFTLIAFTHAKSTQPTIATSFTPASPRSGNSSMPSAPIPTSANAAFSERDSQLRRPVRVPSNGPRLRSTKKYVPPAFGMAVASSALASMEGTTISAAMA